MEVSAIIAGIDEQIVKLQRARRLLESELPSGKARRGRSDGIGRNESAEDLAAIAAPVERSKHKVSPEGRKRIADAMKRRWAEHRKNAGQ